MWFYTTTAGFHFLLCPKFIPEDFISGNFSNRLRKIDFSANGTDFPPQTQQALTNIINAMQQPQSALEIKAGLETTEKGGVGQSLRNCLTIFQCDPALAGALAGAFAYNFLTGRTDHCKTNGFHRTGTALTDTDMKYLLLYPEQTPWTYQQAKD